MSGFLQKILLVLDPELHSRQQAALTHQASLALLAASDTSITWQVFIARQATWASVSKMLWFVTGTHCKTGQM